MDALQASIIDCYKQFRLDNFQNFIFLRYIELK